MLGQLASNWCYKWWVQVFEFKVAGFRREQLNRERGSNFLTRNNRHSFHLHPPNRKQIVPNKFSKLGLHYLSFTCAPHLSGTQRSQDYLTLDTGQLVPVLPQSRCRTRREGGQGRARCTYVLPPMCFLQALQCGGCFSFFGCMPCCRALIQKG